MTNHANQIPDQTGTSSAAAASSEPARDPDRALELGAEPVRTFLMRARFASLHVPELGLPVLDSEHIGSLLPLVCAGRSSLDEIRGAALVEMIRGTLTHEQAQGLDREAPERIQVPSGTRIRLDYAPEIPVLAVRIQEMFGAAATPTVAGGRQPVLLHLLSPAGRPMQVTQDLAGFWERHYPSVRRQLRRRYPKHPWPEDGRTATPPPA